MEGTCLNCNHTITENFCGNCGQKKYKRIDKKYVLDEIQYTLLHTNKGLLYSLKKIIKDPGKTAREFIEGNRVNHYKPILLLFLLSGISTFISYKILGFAEMMKQYYEKQKINQAMSSEIMSLLSSYNSILMLLLIPLFAITTKISFRKWGHNYYEHIVMNCYIASFYTIVTIITLYPFFFYLKGNPDAFFVLFQASILLLPIILFWFFKGFYYDQPIKSILLRTLAVVGITLLGYIVLVVIVSIGIVVYVIFQGPEALQEFIPKK